nr:deoxyribodipyrimidine photo-lyase [Bacteroidota bacterium]
MVRSILWFRHDLRLHDNEALLEAIRNSDDILPVFIFDSRQFASRTKYGVPKTGVHRTQFLIESVLDLKHQLQKLGSDLIVRTGKSEELLYDLAVQHKAHYVY